MALTSMALFLSLNINNVKVEQPSWCELMSTSRIIVGQPRTRVHVGGRGWSVCLYHLVSTHQGTIGRRRKLVKGRKFHVGQNFRVARLAQGNENNEKYWANVLRVREIVVEFSEMMLGPPSFGYLPPLW